MEAFYRLGVQDITDLILTDTLSSAYWEKKKKKNKETKKTENLPGGFFLSGQTCPAGSAALGYSRLLGAIKSCFKDQSLNFMWT
jgi:hypothetical protein